MGHPSITWADERPRIQLADASGPHPLSDESNYEFLQKVFDAKEKDPLAKKGYDVKSVFQILMGEDWPQTVKKRYDWHGQYVRRDLRSNPDAFLYRSDMQDIEDMAPDLIKKGEGVIMNRPWNTEKGVKTLMHEFRHRAINQDPFVKKIVESSPFSEEIINRAMDVRYFNDEEADFWLMNNTYLHNKKFKKEKEQLEAVLDLIETNSKLSEDERNFREGGLVSINYLTRRL